MGGSGSGRHGGKSTVEDCRWLDANRLMKEGILRDSIKKCGWWSWSDASTGEERSSIEYEVKTIYTPFPWLRLHYKITNTQENVDYKIPLQTTKPHFGGLRWWFTCPLTVGGRACNRRVRKLYLGPGGKYFGCRHCYDLTYESSKDSHKFDRVIASVAYELGITPTEAKKALRRQW